MEQSHKNKQNILAQTYKKINISYKPNYTHIQIKNKKHKWTNTHANTVTNK